MAWLKFNSKALSIEELQRSILEGTEITDDIRRALASLDPETGWALLKITFPRLSRNMSRDLTRILFNSRLPFLQELLCDRRERDLVIECLGYLASRESVEILVALLSHKDDAVQLNAAGALKNHTPRLVVPSLVEALLSGTGPPARVGEVLLEMGFLAMEKLVEVYPKAEPLVQSQILEVLTLARYPKIKALVASALRSENKALKLQGLKALNVFAYDDLWEDAVFCLVDTEWVVRAKTLQVLEQLGVQGIEDLIEPFTRDKDPWVCQCAEKYLASLAPRIDRE